MFWGLIMEPNKRYTQTVEKAFHMSMASLDASTASGSLVQVMICYDNRNYLLCTLQKGSIWQVPLDLNFQEGTKIAFTCNGDGHVHLTGYLVPEEEGFDDVDGFDEMEGFNEEDAEDDEEVPTLVGPKKRKAQTSPKENNAKKPAKKSKVEVDEDDSDESESDDESADGQNGLLFDEDDSEEDDDDELDGEDDDEDDDDDDEEEDESSDDEEVEEEQVPVALTKKQLKQQKQQQKQNQQKEQNQQNQSKKGKEKLVNGKEAKPEKDQGKQKKNNSKTEEKPEPKQQQQQQKRRTVEGGVQVEDLKLGEGAPAKSGKFVSVYYIGRLKNGKKFDQTQQGEGFKFRLGKGEVIKGWDVGIAGMKVGGKRRLTIPPNMAYGAKGSLPVIPPNSQLNFEVELKAIH